MKFEFGRVKNYVGGEWVDSTGRESFDVANPATLEKLGSVPVGTAADVDAAVQAAADVPLRLVERLAVLLRAELAQLAIVLFHHVAEVEEDACAGGDGDLAPRREGLLGCTHRGVDVRRRAKRNGSELFAGRGVGHLRAVPRVRAPRIDPRATDVVFHPTELELHV